jgi:hypothetical protein
VTSSVILVLYFVCLLILMLTICLINKLNTLLA